jgi:mycothiol synthase
MAILEGGSPQLCMQRDDLEHLPEIELPPGYSLRTSQPGDGVHWAAIMNEAFRGDRTEESFVHAMVEHPAYRPDRIFFACDPAGLPCATASAYRHQRWGPEVGYVHFVATRPSQAGQRLGYAVSLAVLHKFREEGCRAAVLETDDFRLGGIKTYLRLGFHPLLVHESQPERWRRIFAVLGIKGQTHVYLDSAS